MERTASSVAVTAFLSALAFFSSAFLLSCATLPDTKSFIREVPSKNPSSEIFASQGVLSPEKGGAIFHRIENQGDSTDILKRQTPLMDSISDLPLVGGNEVTLLLNAPAIYGAMLQAIRGARDHINFETFIFADDREGRRFAEVLLQKRAEGVQVNLIYDSLGCFKTPPSFFQRLREGGINIVEFNPINSENMPNVFQRDHRKILIVDGEIAFTGGVNIGHISSRGEHGGRDGKRSWRDTDIQLKGPVVADFQRLFLETWKSQKGPELSRGTYFPDLRRKGGDLVRVVGSSPGKMNRLTYMMYVAAVTYAEKSIYLTNAYFVPEEGMLNALTSAAGRGVDVKIILPGRSDSAVVLHAGRSHYSRLLEAGVQLYERRGPILHAKTAVIDGVWSTVGSTNMDLWSFLRNNEVNAVIVGRDFAEQMEDIFRHDLYESDQIRLEEWESRPLISRFKEWFAGFFAYWL